MSVRSNAAKGPPIAKISLCLRIWRLIKRVTGESFDDSIPTVAGGITFFILLALFPAISATVSLFGLFADPAETSHELDLISNLLPEGGVVVLRSELQRLASQKPAALNIEFLVSFVVALWSASGGFKALVEGLNVAYEVKETRGFVRQTLDAAIFTAGAIILAAIAIGLGTLWRRNGDASPTLHAAGAIMTWPILFIISALALAVIYHFGPNRAQLRWRWITWGSAVAAVLWMFGTQLFTWYVQHFGSYNRVYGDLGAVVGFLTWIWLSLVVLLLGAEINCELERPKG